MSRSVTPAKMSHRRKCLAGKNVSPAKMSHLAEIPKQRKCRTVEPIWSVTGSKFRMYGHGLSFSESRHVSFSIKEI
jgi:hypothetical protein